MSEFEMLLITVIAAEPFYMRIEFRAHPAGLVCELRGRNFSASAFNSSPELALRAAFATYSKSMKESG